MQCHAQICSEWSLKWLRGNWAFTEISSISSISIFKLRCLLSVSMGLAASGYVEQWLSIHLCLRGQHQLGHNSLHTFRQCLLIPPFHWATIRSRSKPIWKSGPIGNKCELNGSGRKLSGNEWQRSGMGGNVGGDFLMCSKIAPDLRGSGTGHRSSVRSVSWSSLIVSWSDYSGTQRVLIGCRILSRSYPLWVRSTHDWLTLWSSSASDPTPTKADLPPINLRCTPAFPDPYKTRFGLFPLKHWGCAGEATHKGSLKVSFGLWQGRRSLDIGGATFKKSIPSTHPFPHSAIYSTEDFLNCSVDNAIFFICSDGLLNCICWCRCSSIRIIVPGQFVAQERHTVSEFEPKAGHHILDPWYLWARTRDWQWSAHIYIWSGQISPIRSYPECKLVCMSVPRVAHIISGSSSS